jgi:integrase
MASVHRVRSKEGFRYRTRWRDPDGTLKSRSFAHKADASRFAVKVEHEMNVGDYIDPHAGRVTVREYGEKWRKAQLQHATSTAADVAMALRVHLYPALGNLPIGSVRPSDVQAWVAGLTARLAPSTVTKTYSFLSSMLKSAVRDGLISRTPCIDINLPRIEKKRVVPLTVEQVAALIDAAHPQYRALLHFCAGTGTRAREAFGLTVDRIDFLRRQVTIDRQLATRDGSIEWKAPKTPSSVRSIPLDDGVIEAVASHLAAIGSPAKGIVFSTPRGRAIDLHRAYGEAKRPGWFRKAARSAGLPDDITLHDLRHFYASLLIRNGASVKLVQARLGHKSALETLDTYGHLWPDSDEQTRSILNEALFTLRHSDRVAQDGV